MEWKKTGNPDNPVEFTFSGWEISTLRAVYTEITNKRRRAGNTSSVFTGFDDFIVNFPKSKQKMVLRPTSPSAMAETIDEFVEDTESAEVEIASLPLPLHENTYAAERRRFGEWAASLAAEIRKVDEPERSLEEASDDILRAIDELPGPKLDDYRSEM